MVTKELISFRAHMPFYRVHEAYLSHLSTRFQCALINAWNKMNVLVREEAPAQASL